MVKKNFQLILLTGYLKYATNLVNTQKATNLSLNKLRAEYDKKLTQEKDEVKKVELVNEANKN